MVEATFEYRVDDAEKQAVASRADSSCFVRNLAITYCGSNRNERKTGTWWNFK
jgi:hypothetical protein